MDKVKPTKEAYEALQFAYDLLNDRLFAGSLPGALITLNRTGRSFGHLSPKRFARRDGMVTDEINLNPLYFATRPVEDTLSTLAHEQCHQWREYNGKPPRRAYHDQMWAQRMIEIGLQPSSTGSPGGKTVGEKMSHYIMPEGEFIQVCKELLTHTSGIVWFDRYPQVSRKDYTYAGTIAVPAAHAKAARVEGSVEIGGGCSDVETESGPLVEVPVFSASPVDAGLDVAHVQQPGTARILPGGKTNASNRTTYSCGGCNPRQNIWGKPGMNVICGDCRSKFSPKPAS